MISAGQQVNCDDFQPLSGIAYSRLAPEDRTEYNRQAAVCLESQDPMNFNATEVQFFGFVDQSGSFRVRVENWMRDLIIPLVCNPALTQDERTQCEQHVKDSYDRNRPRVPELLRPIFDGFAKTMTDLLINSCNLRLMQAASEEADAAQSFDRAFSQCMYQAGTGTEVELLGTRTPIELLGVSMTYPNFFTAIADMLNGQTAAPPPADNNGENRCRPVLIAGGLQTVLREIRAAYPDNPETDVNESDEAVDNYLQKPLCSETQAEFPAPSSTTPPEHEVRSCQPTFTQIQICEQEHSAEGDAVVMSCAEQMCEASGCVTLPFDDLGGERDMADGVSDQRDCSGTTPPPAGRGIFVSPWQ